MTNHDLPQKIDLSKCILWQYEYATRLQSLVKMMEDATNMASVELWKKAFYIFDLDREIDSQSSDYEFRIYGLHMLTILFGLQRPHLVNGGLPGIVSDNTWRRYIKGMIWLMDSDGSCEDINKWLAIIFPNLTSYVIDSLDMTITYKFYPTPASDTEEWQLLHINGFLPHPAGVLAITNFVNEDTILGTDGQNEGQLNHSRFGAPTT